jgi:hypothetical protein
MNGVSVAKFRESLPQIEKITRPVFPGGLVDRAIRAKVWRPKTVSLGRANRVPNVDWKTEGSWRRSIWLPYFRGAVAAFSETVVAWVVSCAGRWVGTFHPSSENRHDTLIALSCSSRIPGGGWMTPCSAYPVTA